MVETVKKEFLAKIVILLFLLFTIWWVTLQFMHLPNDSIENQIFAAVYGVIAFIGGISGLFIARKWGGLSSIMGKSIFLFSLGLIFQEIGQISYSYFIYFLKQEVPYPSMGDFFFYSTIPLYILAIFYLAQASGIKISLTSFKGKVGAFLIPIIMLLLSYFIFLQGYQFDWTNSIKIFLDFVVPFGQAIYISFAILTYILTKSTLGGMMRNKILLILLALLAQYVADWTFLYQASNNIWYAGGINDYMYLFSYFLMTIGLLNLKTLSYKKVT